MAMTSDQELRIKALEQAVAYTPKAPYAEDCPEAAKHVVTAAETFYEFLAKGKQSSGGASFG